MSKLEKLYSIIENSREVGVKLINQGVGECDHFLRPPDFR